MCVCALRLLYLTMAGYNKAQLPRLRCVHCDELYKRVRRSQQIFKKLFQLYLSKFYLAQSAAPIKCSIVLHRFNQVMMAVKALFGAKG